LKVKKFLKSIPNQHYTDGIQLMKFICTVDLLSCYDCLEWRCLSFVRSCFACW